jgi:hypothetical protein
MILPRHVLIPYRYSFLLALPKVHHRVVENGGERWVGEGRGCHDDGRSVTVTRNGYGMTMGR